MKRHHYAIITGQILSYALIITFIFADRTYDFTGIFYTAAPLVRPNWDAALVSACLVALVGTMNVWLSFYYMQKSSTVQDWVVVCAWTHRVKHGGRWISLEDFLSEQLGCQVSHGLSEEGYSSISHEIDTKWRTLRIDPETGLPIQANVPRSDSAGPAESSAAG